MGWAAEASKKQVDPAIQLRAGDVIEFEYGQWTRERAGSGQDRFHQERLVKGTATLFVLEPRKDGGWHAAWYSELDDEISWPTQKEKKSVKRRWIRVTLVELTSALQLPEESSMGNLPTIGNRSRRKASGDAPEGAPLVPIPIPSVQLRRLGEPGAWEAEIAPIAPFAALKENLAEHRVDELEKERDRVLHSRIVPGDEVTYNERFLIDRKARSLAGAEFTYHQCGGGGNTRQVTSVKEKSRRTLSSKELDAAREAAGVLKRAAALQQKKPAEAKKLLAALKKNMPGCAFMSAVDAALEGLSTAR
jgi:hypothetical protein